ncbi:MAG: hypothetical protein ABI406_14705 [Ktedonobacteraceae bacterium]
MMRMHIVFTHEFRRAYKHLPRKMQKIVDDKIVQLSSNPAHPSLQVHKHRQGKAEHLWICYISMNNRLLYQYKDGSIYLRNVGNHNIVERI